MQLFSADAKIFLNLFKKIFLPTKSWKNNPKNLLTYGSWEFFLCSPDCPKQPRTSFMFCKFFYPIISARISGCPVGPQYKSLVTFFYVANWYPFRPLCNTHGGDFLLGGWQRGGKSHVSSWVSVECQIFVSLNILYLLDPNTRIWWQFFYLSNWYPFRPLCNTHGGDFLLGGWQRGGKSHVSSWVSVKCQSEKIRWGTCAKLVCSLIFLPSRHGKPDLLTWP